MKKWTQYLVLFISGVGWIVAGYFSCYYYNLYRTNATELEYRCDALQSQSHTYLIPFFARGEILTTDQLPPVPVHDQHGDGHFYFNTRRLGPPEITPAIQVPAGSTNRLEFDIHYDPETNEMAGVWLSHAEPYQSLAMFDEFEVYRPPDTNVIRLVVQPKPGASFKFEFTVVVLRQR